MNVHGLKTQAQYWDAVAAGTKPFELRLNDRQYAVGDRLVLFRLNGRGQMEFPCKLVVMEVTYVLDGADYPQALDSDYVILGIRPDYRAGADALATATPPPVLLRRRRRRWWLP